VIVGQHIDFSASSRWLVRAGYTQMQRQRAPFSAWFSTDLRQPACRWVQLIQLLEKDDLVQWWKAFEQNDGAAFSEMMKIPLERLELLYKEKVYDDRTVQLLRDALTWRTAHPEQLLEGGTSRCMRRT
jgi:hypothetical protein